MTRNEMILAKQLFETDSVDTEEKEDIHQVRERWRRTQEAFSKSWSPLVAVCIHKMGQIQTAIPGGLGELSFSFSDELGKRWNG